MTCEAAAGPARDFVQSVIAAVDRAPASDDAFTSRYSIGGSRITIEYRSPRLEQRFVPALAHLLLANDCPADLTITVADPRTVNAAIPPLPWGFDEYRACGEIRGFVEGPYYTHLDVPMSALSVFSEQTARAVYWCRQPAELPAYECAGPLRAILHRYFLRTHDMPLVHAGAVALNGKAALIIGEKGAGKSTTAMACLAAGLSYLGDDKILVDGRNSPQVFSVFGSAKIFVKDLHQLSLCGLAQAMHPPVTKDDEKGILYLSEVAPDRIIDKASLAAIIQPFSVGGVRSELVPLNSGSALLSPIPELVGRYPSTAARAFEILHKVFQTVPCYRLHAGRDLKGVAAVIRDILFQS
jgi:hypothetical protein